MATTDITTLKSLVRSGLSGSNYDLTLALLNSPALTTLANDNLPGATLRLSAATLEEPPDGKSIIVHGTGVDLPFTGLTCAARFSVRGDVASLQLSAHGDHTWLLSTGFPPLSNNLAKGMRFADSLPPTLYLYSDLGDDGRRAGLRFEGGLDLDVMTGGLSSLLGRQYQSISGPFVLKQQGAELSNFDLTGEAASGVNLGVADKVDLTFSVGGWLGTSPYDGEEYILPYLTIGANIPFTAQGESHVLPVTLTIFNLQGDFRFETNLTGLVDAAVDEVEALTQKIGLKDIVPTKGGFQLQNYLSLSHFFFDFNPTTSRPLKQIGVDVQNAHPWTIIHLADSNKNWVLDKATLLFRVTNPGAPDSNKSLIVNGELHIGSAGVLLLSTSYPQWEFDLVLKIGTMLNLTEVLEEFVGSVAGAPKLQVNTFELHIVESDYSLALVLQDDWILDGASIQEVGFIVNHQAGNTKALIFGIFDINSVSINVTADHPGGADTGWKFQGSTGPDQKIPIGKLISDLATIFNIDSNLPSSITGLIIDNLDVMFDTQTRDFTFTCEAMFPIDNQEVDIVVAIAITKGADGKYSKNFGGQITIGGRQFKLIFSQDSAVTSFVATYSHSGTPQSISIKELVANVSANVASFIPEGLTIDLKDVIFAFSKSGTESTFLFGLDISVNIPSLSNLPLVGRELPADQTIKVDDLQLLVSSKAIKQDSVTSLNELIPDEVIKLPGTDLSAGLNLSASMNFGGSPQILAVPVVSAGTTPSPTPLPISSTQAGITSADNAKWFTLQKSFGPVHFNRVGVKYQDGIAWFLLDASLSVAVLTLSLDGLAFGSPLSKFDPKFDLHGLGIDYQSGPAEIGGAFLRTQGKLSDGTIYDEYDGAAVIKTEELTLSALGSYAVLHENPSLFIYAVLDYPLGGPSFFFITGLAAGFGYNRSLIVPPVDQVAQFPLVAAAVNGASPPQNVKDLTAELALLAQYIHPEIGEIFFAIGIKFTSFKIIDSFVLLTIAFGNELEINVLGLSTMTQPPPVPGEPAVTPLAVVQMAVKVSFIPAQGFLGVSAQLTSASYIISTSCRLTGGFAFYTWFAGVHAGDFVQTLGGYHPSFIVPDHYPRVPRLGYNWQVDDELSIKGGAYFALTASLLMAGLQVQANWNSGNLQAWFNVAVDFIIAWKPFHYDATAHADLGVSYTFDFFGTHHLTFDVGADLHIWGPEFSGQAHINLDIISFDVSFGVSSAQAHLPIDWPTFKQSFLPSDAAICGISVTNGLIGKQSQDASDLGVINPKYFVLTTNSLIPSSRAHIHNDLAVSQVYYTESGTLASFTASSADGNLIQPNGAKMKAIGSLAIGPMGIQFGHFTSTHSIVITRDGNNVELDFTYTPILKNVPVGMWGQSLNPNLNGQRFVDDALSGFEIRPAVQVAPGETAPIDRSKLQYEPEVVQSAFSWTQAPLTFQSGSFSEPGRRQTISTSIIAPSTVVARQQLCAALGVSTESIDLNQAIASTVANTFLLAPQVEKV